MIVVNAPGGAGTAVLTAFGALVTVWLLSGPFDDHSKLLSLLLPPFLGYEIARQSAAKGSPGRESFDPMPCDRMAQGGFDSRPVAERRSERQQEVST